MATNKFTCVGDIIKRKEELTCIEEILDILERNKEYWMETKDGVMQALPGYEMNIATYNKVIKMILEEA